jgi:hypothetical protein
LGLKSDPVFRFRMLLRILRMNMRGRRYRRASINGV